MANYFYYEAGSGYPKDKFFRPDEAYPEYPFTGLGIAEGKNDVYRMIRSLFKELDLDADNYGKKCWNPLKAYISEGQTVLIKPNLVNDTNPAEKNRRKGMDCLITHPSVIRCIVDYVLIALNGTGKVVIADAPIQDCSFASMKRVSGYVRLEEFYSKAGYGDIEIQDLRETILVHNPVGNCQQKNSGMSYGSKIVNLSDLSYFYGIDGSGGWRITNYDANSTNRHHKGSVQEYCVSSICLDADVIINVPKPKTHRLAGYTGALKNFVGINARKEYLPHHRKGTPEKSGDEYPEKSIVKYISSMVDDLKNAAYAKQHGRMAEGLLEINENIKYHSCDKIFYGMWYGNDTIWRTILDLNRIVNYCDKNGKIQKDVQREIINIGDMIVCGDREGPLSPSYKYVGGILFSDNAVEFDLFLTGLMGFDNRRFPTLVNAVLDKKLYKKELYAEKNGLSCFSNSDLFKGRLCNIHAFSFELTSGWKGRG